MGRRTSSPSFPPPTIRSRSRSSSTVGNRTTTFPPGFLTVTVPTRSAGMASVPAGPSTTYQDPRSTCGFMNGILVPLIEARSEYSADGGGDVRLAFVGTGRRQVRQVHPRGDQVVRHANDERDGLAELGRDLADGPGAGPGDDEPLGVLLSDHDCSPAKGWWRPGRDGRG